MRLAPAALVSLVALAACAPGQYVPAFAPIDSDGHDLRDAEGRVRVYRGVNVHIAGIFDVGFADGRASGTAARRRSPATAHRSRPTPSTAASTSSAAAAPARTR